MDLSAEVAEVAFAAQKKADRGPVTGAAGLLVGQTATRPADSFQRKTND